MLHHCLNERGAELAMQMKFTGDFDKISRLTGYAAEMMHLLKFAGNFPAQDYYDLTDELVRIKLPGPIRTGSAFGIAAVIDSHNRDHPLSAEA